MSKENFDYAQAASKLLAETLANADEAPFLIAMRLRRLAVITERRSTTAVAAGGFQQFGDYQIAALLERENRELQPSEIARYLMITRAGVTGRLARLERQGTISRLPLEGDARAVLVQLTKSGRKNLHSAFTALRDSERALVLNLTEDRQAQLSDLLKQVLGPHDPDPHEKEIV